MAFIIKDSNLGEFKEAEYGKWFSYRATTDAWALSHGLNCEIDVLDGVRYAKVLKTVAHVATDENPDGTPVLEKWNLKNHSVYCKN